MHLIALAVLLCGLTTFALVAYGFWKMAGEIEVEVEEPVRPDWIYEQPVSVGRSARQMAIPGKNPAIKTRRTRQQ